MKGVKEIRNRIKAVQNTAKITRAMQLVASSKMKKAQQLALCGRPYMLLLTEIAEEIAKVREKKLRHPFFEQREVKNRGLLVIGTPYALENIAVKHGVSCIEYRQPQEVIGVLRDIPNNISKYEAMAAEGRRQVLEHHNREKISRELFGLFS